MKALLALRPAIQPMARSLAGPARGGPLRCARSRENETDSHRTAVLDGSALKLYCWCV